MFLATCCSALLLSFIVIPLSLLPHLFLFLSPSLTGPFLPGVFLAFGLPPMGLAARLSSARWTADSCGLAAVGRWLGSCSSGWDSWLDSSCATSSRCTSPTFQSSGNSHKGIRRWPLEACRRDISEIPCFSDDNVLRPTWIWASIPSSTLRDNRNAVFPGIT